MHPGKLFRKRFNHSISLIQSHLANTYTVWYSNLSKKVKWKRVLDVVNVLDSPKTGKNNNHTDNFIKLAGISTKFLLYPFAFTIYLLIDEFTCFPFFSFLSHDLAWYIDLLIQLIDPFLYHFYLSISFHSKSIHRIIFYSIHSFLRIFNQLFLPIFEQQL